MKLKVFLMIVWIGCLHQTMAQELLLLGRNAEDQKERDEFGEKLVQLAIANHPDLKIADRNTEIAKKQELDAKFGWLNQITVNGNLNELTINPPDTEDGQNLFFPRYNFSVSLPLGIFFSQPIQTKVAREQYLIRVDEKEKIGLELRKSVLTTYNNYLLRKDIYEMQIEILQEEQAILQSNENQFANGEISLEEFNNSNRKYKADVEKLLTYKTAMENTKLELEEFIGADLESVQ